MKPIIHFKSEVFLGSKVGQYRCKCNRNVTIFLSSLLAQKNNGVNKKLVQFQLIDFDKDIDMWPGGGIAQKRRKERKKERKRTAKDKNL